MGLTTVSLLPLMVAMLLTFEDGVMSCDVSCGIRMFKLLSAQSFAENTGDLI